jgi:hypothetical protein
MGCPAHLPSIVAQFEGQSPALVNGWVTPVEPATGDAKCVSWKKFLADGEVAEHEAVTHLFAEVE